MITHEIQIKIENLISILFIKRKKQKCEFFKSFQIFLKN